MLSPMRKWAISHKFQALASRHFGRGQSSPRFNADKVKKDHNRAETYYREPGGACQRRPDTAPEAPPADFLAADCGLVHFA